MLFLFITAIILPFILFYFFFPNKNGLPTNWPLLGRFPALFKIITDNNFTTQLMNKSALNFHINGPWFTNLHFLLTVDPANVHHVLSKKFGNYVKGTKLNEMLEPLGEGILNTDSTLWLYHRNIALSFFNHPKFSTFLLDTTLMKLETGLIPVLDHASKQSIEIDLQNIFLRFMYDSACILMMGHDLMSLSVNLPSFPLLTALGNLEHAAIYRGVLPTFVWKFMRWLDVGYEKRGKETLRMLDTLIYKCIDQKREQIKVEKNENEVKSADLLTLFMDENENTEIPVRRQNNNDKFLRDTIVSFFLAGAETTGPAASWFFCLLSKNPRVLQKIKVELKQVITEMNMYDENFLKYFKEISNKLIYLHAALCETLRLYPSVHFNAKTPIESDILPSGDVVNPNTQIIINMYAMGRMKCIWGDDCDEFKPERWIGEDGSIQHVPSYKFSSFGGGPRSCLGKQMAFTQIKVLAAFIIQNYEIEAVEEHHVADEMAMVLRMKDGFKVKVSRI